MTPISPDNIDFGKIIDALKVASSEKQVKESLFEQDAREVSRVAVEHLNLEEIASFGFSITSPLGQIAEFISVVIHSATSWIGSAISSIESRIKSSIQEVYSFLTSIPGALADALTYVANLVSNAVSGAVNTLSSLIGDIKNAISSIGSSILSGVREFFNAIGNALSRIERSILGSLENLANTTKSIISSIVSDILGGISSLGSDLLRALTTVYKSISDMGSRFSDFLNIIGNSISSGFKVVSQGLSRLWDAISSIPSIMVSAFTELRNELGRGLVWIKDGLGALKSKIETIGDIVFRIAGFFQGFAESLADDPPESNVDAQNLSQGYGSGKAAAMTIKNALASLASVPEFIKKILEGIESFLRDPLFWIHNYVITPIWNGMLGLGSAIVGGLRTFGSVMLDAFAEAGEFIANMLQRFGIWAYNVINKVFSWIMDQLVGLYEVGKSIGRNIAYHLAKEMIGIQKNAIMATDSVIAPYAEEFINSLGFSSPPFLNAKNFAASWGLSHVALSIFGAFSLLTTAEMRAGAYVLRGIGYSLARSPHEIEISLKPIGLGASIRLDLGKVLGSALAQFGEEIAKFGDEYIKALWTGYGIWFGRYLTVWWNYYFRNYIPIEFPSFNDINEAWLRARVAEAIPKDLGNTINDAMEGILYYLKVKGYSDFVIKFWYADPTEFYTTVIDRFQIKRIVPLSGAWKLPSLSEVARMWVRDILRPPGISAKEMIANLTKIYEAAGLYRDIGLLYTLLAFRYPPPERLAEFYWRGISKLLWLSDSLEEPEWRALFNIPDTWKSLSPYEISLRPDRAEILNRMISLYMRWHDYFPVAWNPNFPTDKAIQVELMAELPGRIDLRWMTRWGIFQHLSDANVDVMSDLKTIYNSFARLTGEETRSSTVTPRIELDARFLSRFLISRGLNPLVTPLVSVAQVHAVLASELTLLRTGFIDSLRRGFITLDVSEQLMSGLIKIYFKTGYIDTATGTFKEIVYPKPVFWLPAERRLLQMRALFDRYNMILRDLVNRVVYGISTVAITPEEGITIIREFHPLLSKHIGDGIKAISGIDWIPTLDENYIAIWVQYAANTRKIGIRNWIRRYIARISGWIFYRVIYGWIDPESLKTIIDNMAKIKIGDREIQILSDEEIAFFSNLSSVIHNAVKKELIPSPSTLATLAEYLDIDVEIAKTALSTYRIPSPFDSIYLQYIQLKPIKSDFKALLNRARSAFVKGIISKSEWDSYLSRAISYGFTKREIQLIQELADLESLISEAHIWSPTPATLASLSEYIKIPDQLIEQALQRRGITEQWKDLWKQYISIRPIADDARALLNSYYRALRTAMFYGAEIPKDLKEQALAYLNTAGVTSEELAIRDLAAQLDVLSEEIRRGEVIPTLAQLATMSEYIEIPANYVQQILEKRRMEQTYKELWMKYISARTIASETGRVVNAFVALYTRYAVPQEVIDTVKNLMVRGGWTQRELTIFDLELYLRRYYRTLVLLIPTIRGFIADGQYLPQYESILEDLFRTYAINLSEFSKQVEYYKTLLKNRRLWRHFAWYRTQLTYAYQYGAMTEQDVRNALKKFVDIGLIDNNELEVIVEGIKIRAKGYAAYRAMRYGGG
ncbi:MAG: hypothetical protein DSO07_05160 [Thermoproteota archaeon]|nr:MAG: hypothetical protein DSO07_05160 [Candidatus Korarchaeota archaeon]